MRRTVIPAILLCFGALILAACATSPGGGGPILPERTQLQPAGETTPAFDGNLASGEIDRFVLDGGSVGDDLIVLELDSNLRLELTTATGATVLAVSDGPAFFSEGALASNAQAAGGAAVDPAAIRVDPPPCRGSCIVVRASNNTFNFQVRGVGAPTDYAIYIYGAPYVDSNEPGNDGQGLAGGYFLGEEDAGAIETVDDVDWWQVTGTDPAGETVLFTATGELELELEVLFVEGGSEIVLSGQEIQMLPGDLLRVTSTLDRASRGAQGYYFFSPVDVVELAPGARSRTAE